MASLNYFNEFIKSNEEDYWLNNLAGELVKTGFPYTNENPPPNVNQHQRRILKFQLGGKLYLQLMKLSNDSEVRLHMILTAALVSLLNKYTGNQDIIVGTTIYKQEIDAEFINTVLILRTRLTKNMTFKELLLQVRQRMTEVVENQNYPLERLLQKLEIPFSKNDHFPIFDVAIIVENIHDKRYLRNITPNMLFSFSNKEEYVEGTVEYNAFLYKIKAIERVTLHLNNLLNEVLDNINLAIDRINILTPGEKRHLLYEVNNTKIKYPADKILHELFEEQVAKAPENTAVTESCRSESITYRELNRKSNQLARLLRSRGVKTEEITAIMVWGSVELIIGIMGILKAGGGYLPIDPETPVNRTMFMLEDSGASILLTSKALIPGDRTSGGHYPLRDTIFIEDEDFYVGSGDNLETTTKPMNIAYVMFTSGTSGRPKGVMVHHRGVVNYINWAIKTYVKDEKVDFPLYTSISFDLTVTSIFIPLLTGSSIVVYSGEYKELLIGNIIDDDRVGIVKITPSHLKLLREREVPYPYPGASQGGSCKRNIKHFIVGGEELNQELAKTIHESFNGQIEIYNEYGPTETVVGSMIYKFNPAADQGKSVPIGIPVYNTQVYILDGNQAPVPLTVTGEIYISGDGVARGYLNRPELTAEKFLENPFVPGERMYRTGDIGGWIETGKMEFSGRIDHQLKIRGYRIEPGEIERLLLEKDEIKEAIAVVRDDDRGDKYLCVYIVSGEKLELNKLKEYLSKYLPAYMIPAYIMQTENIPLTPNGKVDRKAMPAPQPITVNKYASPRDKVEKILTEIWENVLGINNIGINDNFFTIGGDSIKTIQIVSRVKKAGYKIEMRDIFQESTIARLAPLLKRAELIADQSVVSGAVPLTPIQHWFFKSQFPDHHYFNQAVLLYSQEGFSQEAVRDIFLKLQEHHDALRMTFHRHEGEIVQENHGLDYPFSLQVFDYRQYEDAVNALESTANHIQASIDLTTGPLMKLGLFHLEDGDRLLIVIHHLVIDGVSWRILFEDIETLYRQYKQGKPLSLPLKTDSFKAWSAKLLEYADSESFLKGKAYWLELESLPVRRLEKNLPREDNDVINTKTLSFSISETETAVFLTKVNEAFGTDSNDILLTALGLSMKKTWGHHRFLVALEGHGREEIFKDLDISRTFGWFTTIYPIILDIAYENDLSRQIKEIKETLRHVPGKGIGYGVMKYFTAKTHKEDIEFKLKPQISFNYLGQFDADIKQISSFEIAKESPGKTQSLRNKGEYELNISGIAANNRLTMNISYNESHFKPGTIAALVDDFESELKHLITFCRSKENIEFSPSDFTYKGLSIEAVDRLMGLYPDVEDIYTLNPTQEGILFNTLYDPDSSAYFVQTSYRFHGELAVRMVKKSLEELFKRHEILRTAFLHEGFIQPFQVVLEKRKPDFYYQDIRQIIPGNSQEKEVFINKFKEKDRKRKFDLSKDILVRLAVLQLGEKEYEFIWSFHHILMDGWCTSILNAEFFEIYRGLSNNNAYHLPKVTPYRTYIEWLAKQDKEKARKYWENLLAGYHNVVSVPMKRASDSGSWGYNREEFHFMLDREKTNGLEELAAKKRVTLSVVMQTIWGIMLMKYNDRKEVVFGIVVSGRPTEIEGVESMVGLFINTIPLRLYVEKNTSFTELLQEVQKQALEGEPYHYYSLAEIQTESELKQNLIDHFLTFLNYPVIKKIGSSVNVNRDSRNQINFEISNVETLERSNYDLDVLVYFLNTLTIKFRYNTNIYDSNFMKKMADHIKEVIDQVLENNKILIKDIKLSSQRWEVNLDIPIDDGGDFDL